MKDRRVMAFSTIRNRLTRARAALRDTLAEQQRERDEADARLAEQQSVLAHAAQEVDRRTARIDRLLDGRGPVRIDELLDWEKLLADAHARRARELDALQRLRDGVAAIEQAIGTTRTAILRHDMRIDLCSARLDRLNRLAEACADDLQDEESEETFVARRSAAPAAHTPRRGAAEGTR